MFKKLRRFATFVNTVLSKKKQLIISRLSNTLNREGYKEFKDFVDEIVVKKNQEKTIAMLNRLTTNYTFFLREKEHFNFLEQVALPEICSHHKMDKKIQIWSAGCSSGEEPYTIAMYMLENLKTPLWRPSVLATDISQKIMGQAKNATYRKSQMTNLPPTWQKKYFELVSDGTYLVKPQVKKLVSFKEFNLMNPIMFPNKFDIIFCRNVMIYFDQKTREDLVNRFYDALRPGGYLFIGHSESINGLNTPFTYIKPAIYQKK